MKFVTFIIIGRYLILLFHNISFNVPINCMMWYTRKLGIMGFLSKVISVGLPVVAQIPLERFTFYRLPLRYTEVPICIVRCQSYNV